VQQDFSLVKSKLDVCGSPDDFPQDNFTCIAEDGFPYEGSPNFADSEAGTGNEIKAGVRPSSTRLLLDVSYLVAANISIGLRGGYVLNTAPDRQKAKFHGELRLAYWFGNDPFAKDHLRPYVAVMGGIAEVDDKFKVECGTPANQAKGLTPNPTLTVWRHSGGSFAGLAGGVMIPTASNQGIMVEVKGQAFFPFPTYTISPSVGYAVGF
jgi:hypothetical protein